MGKSNARMQSPVERALRTAVIGLFSGAVIGLAFAAPIWLVGGEALGVGWVIRSLLIGFPLGGLVGGLIIGFVFQEGIGSLVGSSLQGSHGRTVAEYSHAATLVIRGAYEDAMSEYAAAAEADPRDPKPLLLGARVLRDNLRDPETAAEWLLRARQIPKLSPQHDITITRELVGLYDGPLETPEKALPELARLIGTYPDTKAAEWARNTSKRLRAAVWTDLKGETED